MKKQFLRVKQIADQTFLRAEKSDVLTEDLLIAEKRVDSIKASCQTIQKKITACQIDFGSETSVEKRLKKIPQVLLGASMLENGNSFFKTSVLGDTLRECASIQTKLGSELLDYYSEVERLVLRPVSGVLDNEVHNISKLRKQLGKLVLDMDSARTRFQTAEKHSLQASSNNNFNTVGKVDTLKDELEDASQKVDQCRDMLATEMFSLISKEPQLAELFVQFHQLQATYHRNALAALEVSLPLLHNITDDFPQKPVYGCSLEEHLRVTNRDIAQVIEICVSFLMDYGILEEGLLRITGSASKLKKLKSAFDAGIDLDMVEYIRDPHAVSGALKSYLRELPEPLLTYSLYNEWMNAAKLTDFEGRLKSLWQVLHMLPEANFNNLKCVIKFLTKVNESMDVNKMSSQNIAIVMAPNLIWSPSEDTSIGMNMSTASLHTSIVDLLISYFDYFFPEKTENSNTPQIPSVVPNINENQKNVGNDSYTQETEMNGNNLLQATNSTPHNPCPPSPRSMYKNLKKPAAPPPPLQNTTDTVLTGELIDFSREPPGAIPKCDELSKPSDALSLKDKSVEGADIQKQAAALSESVDSTHVSFRFEKPVIPDKPNYSTYSLDRKANRQSANVSRMSRGPSKIGDAMSRSSHIERPSVPPPERPVKPPKFSSSENLFALTELDSIQKCSVDADKISVSFNTCHSSADEVAALPKATRSDTSPGPPSKSMAKGNRFDFLVNQKEEKPPERPPRTTFSGENPVVSVADGQFEVPRTTVAPSCASSIPEVSPPPVSPRSVEVEKVKPPRPQPPVPAKPKLSLQTENTSL